MPKAALKSRAALPTPKAKGPAHVPFEEFSVKELDRLVSELEKTKPPGATVELSAMEGSHHSPCMEEMQAVVVQTVAPEGQSVHTVSMYQYCPKCKIAVRVL